MQLRQASLIFSLIIAGLIAILLSYFSIAHLTIVDPPTRIFSILVSLSYSILFLTPLFLCGLLLRHSSCQALTTALLVATSSVLCLIILSDLYLYNLYGFHINGFVLNIILTPGGIESLGGENNTFISASLVVIGIIALVSTLWVLSARAANSITTLTHKRIKAALIAVLIVSSVSERLIYGFAILNNNQNILTAAERYPWYMKTSFRGLAESLGYSVTTEESFDITLKHSQLKYPLKPLTVTDIKQLPNIVWLVAESWRWDMLDPQISPNIWKFAQQNMRFTNHYSSGNGTRMGMFGMFYGLPGSYWFKFLNERRAPVLIEILQRLNYQTEFFTSAKFSYPEFDKTILVTVPAEQMHIRSNGKGWARDRKNVTDLLNAIEDRDPGKPFFSFMFFESSHANYHFPDESVIRDDYLGNFDYISSNISENIQQIKNRYINSCHHLDSQLARITNYLRDKHLLNNTIVVITGDHGEEFMENGRWGHNSQFSDPQIRVPLVLHLPEQKQGSYDLMSSHMDIPAIILSHLGVENPPQDYSDGKDLLNGELRNNTLLASWSTIGYVDEDYKITLPTSSIGMLEQKAWITDTDEPVDLNRVYREKVTQITKLTSDLLRFQK